MQPSRMTRRNPWTRRRFACCLVRAISIFSKGSPLFPNRPRRHPEEGEGKLSSLSSSECLAEALFQPWRRDDPTFSFRWDPEEDVRYALMAGDPTDPAYKSGAQHGANRLAAVGLAALTLVPEMRAGRVRPTIIGGASGDEGFSFAWPIWRHPATFKNSGSRLTVSSGFTRACGPPASGNRSRGCGAAHFSR